MDSVLATGVDSTLVVVVNEPLAAVRASWAAVVIAAFALALSIWQGVQIRAHNRKSVRPHISVRRAFGGGDNKIGLEIRNNGLGPAFILRHVITVNGKDFDACTTDIWDAVREAGLMQHDVTLSGIEAGDVMAAGESFWSIMSKEKSATLNERAEKVCRIMVTVSYASLYGDVYTTVSKPMDWASIRHKSRILHFKDIDESSDQV